MIGRYRRYIYIGDIGDIGDISPILQDDLIGDILVQYDSIGDTLVLDDLIGESKYKLSSQLCL